MKRIAAMLASLVVLVLALPAAADPTAQFWEELGGSASGDGISASTVGIPTGNRQVSVAVGPDGRPVVAYADGDTIRVRRWDGAAWTLVGPSGASGGLPQIVTDANGRMYLAWRQFVGSTGSWEVFLKARDWNGTTWEELGGSGSGGGISGAEGGAGVPAFSLALGPDGTPYLAYQSTTFTEADFATQVAGLHAWTNQVYVRRWSGSAWVFLGSGREGGGASNALSFRVEGHGGTTFVSHNGEHPTLAIGADGRPVVAFIYSSWFEGGNPPEFNGENDDIYAVRWNGAAWEPLGPALPTTLDAVALGAPGGISNSPGWIREVGHDRLVRPSIMVDREGTPVLAWGETNADDGFRYIYVYKFNGISWQGLASPSGQIDKIAFAYDTALAQGIHGPIVVWPRGGGDVSWIAVMEYVPGEGRFMQMGDGSVSPGISVPGDRAFNPRVAVTSAGVPTVAWIDLTPSVPQAFVRTFVEQDGPDLSVAGVTAPAAAQRGESIALSATVHNGGTVATAASTVNFYIGAGTSRAAGDMALGSRNLDVLAPGASATVQLTATVPAAIPLGAWRVVAVADEDDLIVEINEANNTGASSVLTVNPPPAPDLDLTALSAPAGVQAGSALALPNTVANVGTAAAGALTIRFYLSTDDTLDAGDTLLGSRPLTGLAAGASSAVTTTLTVPATTPAGTYRVIAMAALDSGTESSTGNNGAVSDPVSVTVPEIPKPDLTVTAVSVPATLLAGKPLAIGHTVANGGTAAAGGFTVRFYLSTDTLLDAGDLLLGSRTLTRLAAGASDTMVSTVTLPATVAVGTYRVLVVADALGEVTEINETNNTGMSAALAVTSFLPDLTPTALTVPAAGQTGRPLLITSTVTNLGPAPAGASTVRFYLSSDATFDAGDVLLGARAVGPLAVGALSTAVTSVTIPANTSAPASYRVIAVADALGQVAETDETNNTLASTGAVAVGLYRPDLTITALTMPATGATGRPLMLTSTVRNVGPAPAGPFTVRFYLSSDATLDGGDVLLGARMLGGLGAGATSTAVTSLTIPADTSAPSPYRIIAVADALGQQVEADEGNNTFVSPATVAISLYRPDLTITALTTPASGATGRPLAITHSVKNTGPAPAGLFTIRFYLSGDDTLDAGDVLLGTRILGGLGAGATSTVVTTLTIPANTSAPASYRVIAVADALGQQVELDEGNNAAVSAPLSITLYRSDLAMTSMVMPAGGAVGRPASVRFTIANTGPAPSGVFTVRFYLSSDTTLDAGDVLLVTRTGGNLNPGASRTETVNLMIPSDTPPGTYHVIAVTDPMNEVVEMDEGNNVTVSTAMPVTLYRPDLVMTAVGVPAAGAVGRPLAITNTVRNVGPAPAGPFAIRFYLSSDGTLDAGDVLLGTRMLGGLGAGAFSTAVTTLTIPANTSAPATYRVIAAADALAQQAELDETGNALASEASVTITPFRPDLMVTAIGVPSTATAGKTLTITTTVRNAGPAPAGAFVLRFLLSSDDVLDASDVVLGSRTIPGLAGGASRMDTTTVTVPGATTVPAGYRVIAVVDALGQQDELSESNNAMASAPISLTALAPDLTIAVARLSAPVRAGGSLTVYETVRNVGPAPTSVAVTVQFYLSADDVLDASDVLLGGHTLPSVILAGATRVDATTVRVPAGIVVPSPYRVLAVIDGAARQPELDETNNAGVFAAMS